METGYNLKKIEQKTAIFISTPSWKILIGITDNMA